MLLIASLSSLFFACSKKNKLDPLPSGPAITNVSSIPSSTSATITWTTDVSATSQVYYGTTNAFGSSTTETVSTTKNHSVNITGLTVNTDYYFYIASKDAANNTSTAGEDGSYIFTTTAAGPVISAVTDSASADNATITWTTDVAATTQVFYGTTVSFGSQTTEIDKDANMKTAHSVTLTGLSAGTKYYYYVRSANAAGNATTLGDDATLDFTTTSTPSTADMYLMIDDIQLTGTSGTTFEIYSDEFNSACFTGGSNNNLAYMGSAADGSAPHISGDSEAAYTGDKYAGTACWRIPMTVAADGWDGIYVLASGQWRTFFTSETGADLSGPTGTVTLSCYAKVSGITETKIKMGIGDDSAYTDAANIESFGTIGSKASCKKETPLFNTINNSSWTKISVTVGTDPNLTNINGVFLWSMQMTDVVE